MIRTKWGSTFWDALRVERCPPFLPKWWDVSGQLWKKVQLHCDCRLPEDGEEPMAYCEGCRWWFHKSCQQIPDVIFNCDYKQGWFCNHCNWLIFHENFKKNDHFFTVSYRGDHMFLPPTVPPYRNSGDRLSQGGTNYGDCWWSGGTIQMVRAAASLSLWMCSKTW